MPPCARFAQERRNGSRGRDEERSHGLAVADLDHPGRALLVAALARLDHATPYEVFDELPDHVSVRAQNDVIKLRVAHELEGASYPAAFGHRGRLLNLHPTIAP